jgi:hypothetical protein
LATTKDYRDYRTDYAAKLLTKIVNNKLSTTFSRKPVSNNSLKLNARFLKNSFLFNNYLIRTDATKVYIDNFDIKNFEKTSNFLFVVLPNQATNLIVTYTDFLKLKISNFNSALVDTFNFYLQYFKIIPENK